AVPVVGVGLLGHALTDHQGLVTATVLTVLATAAWTSLAARWVRDADPTHSFPDPLALVTVALALGVTTVVAFVQWLGLHALFPGDRGLLVTSAYAVMLLGTAAVIRAGLRLPPQPPTVRSRRGIIGFVAGMTAVAVATGLVVAVAGDHSRIDATTTTATPAPPTPTDLTRVAWRWSEGERIHAVVPAGAGVVVATSRGIVALDGRTGQERWHYRRTYAATDLEPADGGRMVIASIGGRLHAFDAFTGELRWRDEPATADYMSWIVTNSTTGSTIVRTDARIVGPDELEMEYAATDARTGTPTWHYTAIGCESQAKAAYGAVIIYPGSCSAPTGEILALDETTGQPTWRRPLDGEFADYEMGLIEIVNDETDTKTYLDVRTGREIPELPQILGENGFILGTDSGEVLTGDRQLFRLGDTAPLWQAQDTSPPDEAVFVAQPIFLEDTVAVLDGRSCPGDSKGIELVLL
ncbi:MAG: PQQ-binding-like beta-propeller repeat protein, partial [Actinomycetes bacterium]